MSNNYKKQEVRELYHVIYNNRIKQGIKAEDAKRIALDAASLRFGITNDRVRHILYDKSVDNPSYRTFIYMNNRGIIETLRELLESYSQTLQLWRKASEEAPDEKSKSVFTNKVLLISDKIDKYNELIAIIEEVNAHYCSQKR